MKFSVFSYKKILGLIIFLLYFGSIKTNDEECKLANRLKGGFEANTSLIKEIKDDTKKKEIKDDTI